MLHHKEWSPCLDVGLNRSRKTILATSTQVSIFCKVFDLQAFHSCIPNVSNHSIIMYVKNASSTSC